MRKRSGRLGSLVAQLDTQASLPRHIFASSAETRQAWHLQIYLCRRAGIPCSLYLCAQIDCTWILPTNKGSLMVVGEGEKGHPFLDAPKNPNQKPREVAPVPKAHCTIFLSDLTPDLRRHGCTVPCAGA